MSTQAATSWRLAARWILPVSAPPIEEGIIVIEEGRIRAVEPRGGRPVDLDLGESLVIPGLVNAHTHLDLSGLRGLAPPGRDFIGWLRQVIAHRRTRSADQVRDDVRMGLAEALRYGTTLLGDISGDGSSWDALVQAPIRAVVFRELLGLPEERASRTWVDFKHWLAAHPATVTCRAGVSPHAPYSARISLFQAAWELEMPQAVHLAETAAEAELLDDHSGPFVPFLRDLGVWDPAGLAMDFDHILKMFNGLTPVLIVHGNYLAATAPIPANGSLVYCPRTHAAFGHSPHPFREFLKRGVRVALGTDSLASNPDLDVLAEAQSVAERYPDVSGEQILRMATLSGAEALGWADETGSLAPGKSADLVVLPMAGKTGDDPHRLALGASSPERRVMWQGQWVQGEQARRVG